MDARLVRPYGRGPLGALITSLPASPRTIHPLAEDEFHPKEAQILMRMRMTMAGECNNKDEIIKCKLGQSGILQMLAASILSTTTRILGSCIKH